MTKRRGVKQSFVELCFTPRLFADDDKKAWCEAELDKAEDKLKGLNTKIADLEKAIDDANNQVANLVDEIAALTKGIKELDQEVADATAMRKKEHQENEE